MNVGVLRLEAMGMGVARQLLSRDFQVHGCDLRDAAREALVAAGVLTRGCQAEPPCCRS